MKRVCYFLTLILLFLMALPIYVYAQNNSGNSRNGKNDCSVFKLEPFANKQNSDKEFYANFWKGWERRVEQDSDLRNQLIIWGPPESEARLIDNLREICRQYPLTQGTGNFIEDFQAFGRDLLSAERSENLPMPAD